VPAPDDDIPVRGRAAPRAADVGRDLRELSERLGEVLGRLAEMTRRLDQLDELTDAVRRYGSLTDTVAQQATDNARRLTNMEQDMALRIASVEQAVTDSRRFQQQLRLAELAPRELAVFPETMREHIERAEAVETLEQHVDRRMRSMVAYSALAQALFAAVAVILAYLVSRH
jgi:DNA repair exonuclease SbcCD ATPase subunit